MLLARKLFLYNSNIEITGTITSKNARATTMQCGRLSLTFDNDKGTFKPAPAAAKENSREYAKDMAMKALGPDTKVLTARFNMASSGPIIGKTPTFAIQQVNENTAVLYRLKDLKDEQGLIKEGEDLTIKGDGRGNFSVTPTDPAEKERDRVRTQHRSRGSISR